MMIRTQVRLTERQRNALKALAQQRKVSVAELIRQGDECIIATSPETSLDELRKQAIALVGKSAPISRGRMFLKIMMIT